MNYAKRITIVGGGYVGLSLACMLAEHSEVTLLEIDASKVDKINDRTSPIADAGISKWFAENEKSSLLAINDPEKAYSDAELVIIAVPTDFEWQKNSFNTAIVEKTVKDALEFSRRSVDGREPIIVIRSTVPVGFTKKMRCETGCRRIMFSPEFLREGHALEDSLSPNRIIIGIDKEDSHACQDAELFLETILRGSINRSCPVQIISSSEAEAVKLFSNTYLALRIAFFNELDSFAESSGLNTLDIINGMGMDSRIGQYYNNPSFGYGGYCLPKDTRQLLSQYGNIPQNLITAIVESNGTRIDYIAGQILKKAQQMCRETANPDDFRIGIYRTNMKKGSDNCRESATLQLLKQIAGRGFKIEVYEPLLDESVIEEIPDCIIVNDLVGFKKNCAVIIANRIDSCLEDISEKVYTRDVFHAD